jgi:hypothetical protein
MKNKIIQAYMCGVDFQYELGETTSFLYNSIEELKEKSPCWKQCGIVKVVLEVKSVKWIVEQDLNWTGKKDEK